nr:unnamed protein product [Digitaria exilis]
MNPPNKADSIQSADGDDDLQRAAAKAFSLRGLESNRDWRLLDCYNGRLLLARGHDSLEVYNPLSCEHISVPLPQDDMLLDYFSMCLLQGRCNNDASSFRVVSVQHLRHGRGQKLHAIEYDSQRQSWNHHVDWDTLKNIEIEGNEQGKVMHAGNLIFWKYNSVDSVGELNTLHLRVWKLEKLEWKMEKEMQVRKVLGKHAPRGHSYYRVRKVTNGLALLGWSNGNLYFIIDLKTFCVMEKFEFSRHLMVMTINLN